MIGGTAALFFEARRNGELAGVERAAVRGESFIWLILTATGLVSIAMTRFEALEDFAPLAYATLPFSIGPFVWRCRWEG